MSNDVIDSTKTNTRVRRLLAAQLDDLAARLKTEAEVPKVDAIGGDFLDVAQGVEYQELARLSASRLAERARRLRTALARMAEGEYGVCSECGEAIPPKRLLAMPDATTCRACQERLEHRHTSLRANQDEAAG